METMGENENIKIVRSGKKITSCLYAGMERMIAIQYLLVIRELKQNVKLWGKAAKNT